MPCSFTSLTYHIVNTTDVCHSKTHFERSSSATASRSTRNTSSRTSTTVDGRSSIECSALNPECRPSRGSGEGFLAARLAPDNRGRPT